MLEGSCLFMLPQKCIDILESRKERKQKGAQCAELVAADGSRRSKKYTPDKVENVFGINQIQRGQLLQARNDHRMAHHRPGNDAPDSGKA